MPYLALFLALFITAAQARTPIVPHIGNGPLPIVRAQSDTETLLSPLPTYPHDSYIRGKQGWALISYSIDQQGRPQNLTVTESNGQTQLNNAALRVIKDWRFKPAIFQNQAITQDHASTLFTFRTAEVLNKTSGYFIRPYRKAVKFIEQKKFDQALQQINILANKPRITLYEDCMYWYLKAKYHYAMNQTQELQASLFKASRFSGRYLSESNYTSVLEHLFTIQVSNKSYRDALTTFERLNNHSPDHAKKLQAYQEEIQQLKNSTAPITIEGAINQNGLWSHKLLRPAFYLNSNIDQLSLVDIRCQDHRQLLKVESGKTWTIPSQWHNCQLYITGEPGTKIQLSEAI